MGLMREGRAVMPEQNAPDLHLPIMELRQWVIWRYEQRAGQAKPTKVPYQPGRPGLKAASNRPSDWGTYEEARAAEHTGDGIGFVFAPGGGYVGIDLDDCRDPETGKVEGWAQDLVDRLNSYTEISPSGRGLHIYVRGQLPEGGRKRGHIEIYDRGRYFTFTGNPLLGCPLAINDRQDEVLALYEELAPEDITVYDDGPPEPLRLEDAEVIRRAMSAHNGEKFRRLWNGDISGYPSQSEAEMALASMLAFWVGRDQQAIDRLMRKSGLYRPKWDERHYADGRTYGQVTVERAASTTAETFGSNGKHGARGTLSPWGNAAIQVDPETGEVVERKIEGRVDLWPFMSGEMPEPEWLVEGVLLPGMVELFHGEPGCGKTILALGFTRDLVRADRNVLFIDEESGPQMTASRLALMGVTREEAARIHYYPFVGLTLADSDALLSLVLDLEPALVIFDSMADVLTASQLSEDTSTDVTNWMVNMAVRIARSPAEPCVLILDHNTKDGTNTKYARGSGAKKAKADIAFYVEKRADFDAQTLGRVALLRTKNRIGFVPEKTEFVVGGKDGKLVCEPFDPFQHEIGSVPQGPQKMLDLLAQHGGEMLTEDIVRQLNSNRTTVNRWGNWLLNRGLIKRVGYNRTAGFTLLEEGWATVTCDGHDRNGDGAEPSHPTVTSGPLYRGRVTVDGRCDGRISEISEEDDPWN